MMSNGLTTGGYIKTTDTFSPGGSQKKSPGQIFSQRELDAKIYERMGAKGIGMNDIEYS